VRRLGLLLALGLVAGCGGEGAAKTKTVRTQTTKVEVVDGGADGAGAAVTFDPRSIYEREAPGVVTIFSVTGSLLGDDGGLGSGFILNGDGEVATNAHVVTEGEGDDIEAVDEVFVELSDGNRVPAEIRGFDPDADVALLKIDPEGLDLHPLPLGDSDKVEVGEPVAAIGSPFGERQSLTVGIVSAVDRDVESLTDFRIPGAIQTDAAINPGNSGGPLVDANGRVLGLNQQIQSRSGGDEGVGFAVPIDLAKRSLDQLRERGEVDYAYLGVATQPVYPQLAERFDLPVERGAWVQTVTDGGPANKAGLRAGSSGEQDFQAQPVRPGGDVIVEVGSFEIVEPSDLSEAVARLSPGETVDVVIYRGADKRTFRVRLAKRPDSAG